LKIDYARATAIAVSIGQTLAWLLGLWGFLQGNLFLILIAVFIHMGAGQEGQTVQLRNVLGGLTVGQAYSRDLDPLYLGSTLRDAVELTLRSFQADFPICDGEKLVGVLTHARLVEALNRYGADVPIEQVMITDFEPVTPDVSLFEAQKLLVESRMEALPVVDEGRCFLGLITAGDISEVYRLASTRADVLPMVAAVPEK